MTRAKPAVVCLAGTGSGVGKTSLCVGIMRALRERGLTVQAFKTGPDFLDPMHHEAATGRPSVNLDTWMLSREEVLSAFHRHADGADVAVVEGVMGLFDGRDGATEAGSTAQLAKWLGAPVVLVLDASAVARSAAAVAKGYIEFDPQLRLGGLLFNLVGGPAHTAWLEEALGAAGITAAVLGGVPKNEAVRVPERHLGLHMPGDEAVPPGLAAALADMVRQHVDLDALLELGATAQVPPAPAAPTPAAAALALGPLPGGPPVRLAVARDAAFCFYYQDNLALLAAAGAELAFFSPLTDSLPPDVAGVYIGGGYPERYAAELADNRLLRASLHAFAKAGGVVYAECGGLLYLSRAIQPASEEPACPMVGVFPFKTVMGRGRGSMGYVEVETRLGCPLFPLGRRVRGHVHHYSEIVQESVVGGLGQALGSQAGGPAGDQGWHTCYTVTPQIPGAAEVAEGFSTQNVLASYVHLHFGNCPDFAASLVERLRGVDVGAVGAAASEAAQTAAYLEAATASLHTSPLSARGSRPLAHCKSSPDCVREERLFTKQQRLTAGAGHRPHSAEDEVLTARHLAGDPHLLPRHGGLQAPGAAGGVPAPRSLSPAATLPKVVSLGSLASYSPHMAGAAALLPPGDALSPPLSDSPPQLSPREVEQQMQHAAQFGVPPLPLHQVQPLYGQLPQQYSQQPQQYAQPTHPQYGQQQQPYSNGGAENMGSPPYYPPSHTRLALGGQAPAAASWPRLQQQQQQQPAWPPGAGYPAAAGRGGGGAISAFAGAPQQPQQAQHQQQHVSFFAANGGAALGLGAANGRHSRSGSLDQRPGSVSTPASASAPGALLSVRPPSPLDLGLERLSATPYNWQHSHPPSDKIVSLSPGVTEMLWVLGLGARVAAVSDVCDYPPAVVARAKARRSFAAASASSYSSLDRLARGCSSGATSAAASRRESPLAAHGRSSAAAWQAASAGGGGGGGSSGGASPSGAQQAHQAEGMVDEEVLARERPGLVVYEEGASGACPAGHGTSTCSGGGGLMCSSCGAGGGMGQAVLEALVAVGLQHCCRVVCVRRRTLSDVLESMLAVGEAAGVREEALRVVDRLRARLRRLAGEAAAVAAQMPSHPRVLVLQSLCPLRTVGWWVADLVTLAGGSCGLEESTDGPQELTWQQVQAFAPEVLVIAGTQGGSARRPLTDLCDVASLPGWWLLPAVRSSSVFVADASLFCRPGPRLVEGAECLARMLWSERDDAGLLDCACPEQAVLKLSLRPGQRCRPRLLPNHFVPFA